MTNTTIVSQSIAVIRRQSVATFASTEYFIVIYRERGRPARGTMARFAKIRSINMATWQAVATPAGTGTNNLIVIDRECWCPTSRNMAGFANVGGIDVAARQ
jgi:hypothetical protein